MVQEMARQSSEQEGRTDTSADASPETDDGQEHAANGQGDRDGSGSASAGDASSAPATTEEDSSVRSLTFDDVAIASPGPVRSNRGGKRPGSGRKPGNAKQAPKSPATASTARPKLSTDTQAAGALLALAEGGLVMVVGPKAAMTSYERTMIEPPLGRMLARMAPESAARVAAFADPITLLVGIGAYVARVFAAPKDAHQPASAARPAATVPNGMRPSVRPVVAASPPVSGAPVANGQLDRDDIEIYRELRGE